MATIQICDICSMAGANRTHRLWTSNVKEMTELEPDQQYKMRQLCVDLTTVAAKRAGEPSDLCSKCLGIFLKYAIRTLGVEDPEVPCEKFQPQVGRLGGPCMMCGFDQPDHVK